MDRSAARDDPGHPVGRHRHVGQPDARMDREVIDALLSLLDQRVPVNLPGELFGLAADFFERLIDRHGADRHRRVADDPFPGFMDVLPGREVHDRIGAPARRPDHLFDLLFNGGADGRVSDVRIDLHQEIAADDHRLGFRMVDVGRDDRAASRDLVSHELRRNGFRDVRSPGLSRVLCDASAMTVA